MAFDKNKPHSTIQGLPGYRYEQDGVYYSADGREVMAEPKGVEESVVFTYEPQSEPASEPEEVVEVSPTWQCGVCGMSFAKKGAYAMHMRRKHSDAVGS